MNDTKHVTLPDLAVPGATHLVVNDTDATAGAVQWLAERYVMSDAFARVLLGQLARQDGVTEAAAARSVLATAVIEGSTPTSMP